MTTCQFPKGDLPDTPMAATSTRVQALSHRRTEAKTDPLPTAQDADLPHASYPAHEVIDCASPPCLLHELAAGNHGFAY